MNQAYEDITKRLGPPLWWDEYSVPRYDPFRPELCNDIYAIEACLLEIGCQRCGRRFLVAEAWDEMDGIQGIARLSDRIADGSVYWGDPPIHDDPSGNTESSDPLAVVAFWTRAKGEWARVPELEKRIGDE
jgi:hypothetical protein